MAETGQYKNGSDLLVMMDTKAVGHCTTHTVTFSTETKSVAVKPPMSEDRSANAFFKSKRVTGLSAQVKCEGLCFYPETESGYKAILAKWKVGASVPLKLFEREGDTTPYCSGNFIITSLENTAPAGEDATYSVTFDNDGALTIDETKVDLTSTGTGS